MGKGKLLQKFQSVSLRLFYSDEAMAMLTEKQANNILEWEDVHAQKAKRELALRKLPVGIRPIGVGELMDRCADKTMLYETEDDVKITCNSDP